MVCKVKVRDIGAHYELNVFLGPDLEHFANSGRLVVRHDELDGARDVMFGSGVIWEYPDGLAERECGVASPDDTYHCTLAAGHAGAHTSIASDGEHRARWIQ